MSHDDLASDTVTVVATDLLVFLPEFDPPTIHTYGDMLAIVVDRRPTGTALWLSDGTI